MTGGQEAAGRQRRSAAASAELYVILVSRTICLIQDRASLTGGTSNPAGCLAVDGDPRVTGITGGVCGRRPGAGGGAGGLPEAAYISLRGARAVDSARE